MNAIYKRDLTMEQQMLVQGEYNKVSKSKGLAYVLWFFGGVLGVHRFYTGDWVMGLLMLFTLGGLGVWTFIDLFLIGKRVDTVNDEKELDIINAVRS